MTRKRDNEGKYLASPAKAHLTLRIPQELKEKLQRLPNISQYVEQLLYNEINKHVILDDEWDYVQEMEVIFVLSIQLGRLAEKLCEHEYRNNEADELILGYFKAIEEKIEELKKSV